MMFQRLLVTVLLICLSGMPEAARADIFEEFGKDVVSPVSTPAAPVFLTGVGLTLMALLVEDRVSDPIATDTAEDRPLKQYTKYGDWGGKGGPNVIYFAGQAVAGAFGNKNGFSRAGQMLWGTLYAIGLANGLKTVTEEPRPNGWDNKSFPSGHTASAFAFASVVGAEHGWGWGTAAYLGAAFVGYSRMNDNKHWFHDVLGGATIGVGYGLGIHFRRRGPRGTRTAEIPLWDLRPVLAQNGGGLDFHLNF